jgi:hypothetical protein
MILEYYALKNTAFTLSYPAYDGEWSSTYVTAPAALDSEVSKDKGNFADCSDEWTEIQTTGIGAITLTAGEMNCDLVIVKTTSSTVGVNFPLIVIHPYVDVMDIANTELAAVPAATAGLRAMIQFICEKLIHKMTMNKDTGVETVFKANGSSSLGTGTHSDDGTTVTKGAIS